MAARRSARAGRLPVAALRLEAGRAVDGLAAGRLEGHPRDAAAAGAHRLVHLARRPLVVAAVGLHLAHPAATLALAGRTALGATPRLVDQPALSEELLLTGGE